MPTGYTAFIEDGKITTAKDFLMLCTRAFDATRSMGEAPFTTPIPEKVEPSKFYAERLELERKRLERLRSMSADEVEKEAKDKFQEAAGVRATLREKNREIRHRYEDILEEVEAWTPPTEEHKELKRFAIDQIKMCLPFTEIEYSEPVKLTAEQWLENELSLCLKAIERNEKMAQEEIEACDRRNKWLKELRESLGIE